MNSSFPINSVFRVVIANKWIVKVYDATVLILIIHGNRITWQIN